MGKGVLVYQKDNDYGFFILIRSAFSKFQIKLITFLPNALVKILTKR